jgi:1,4-dihydroxy-2-naphthoate octaprenyltransferase
MYIIQSIRLYWRRKFTTFAEFAGAGIFFGTSGFMLTGFVDDSTVSVMPMFYGLLATGIATNIMLKKRYGDAKKTKEEEAGAGKDAA